MWPRWRCGCARGWAEFSQKTRKLHEFSAKIQCRSAGCRPVATGGILLDGTVAFRSIKVVRAAGGRLAFERTYLFDYTLDGNTRQQGFVVMFGQRVETIGLD